MPLAIAMQTLQHLASNCLKNGINMAGELNLALDPIDVAVYVGGASEGEAVFCPEFVMLRHASL